MPRFQSRLFNWIDQSLPAKLGRSARRLIDRQLKQIPSVKNLPRLFAYEVAKASLYPVYLIASTTKRIFPVLGRAKTEDSEKLRSQTESIGLLSESEANTENIEQLIDQDLVKPEISPEIPLLLRPLAKFFNWIDRTKLQLDRNIAAIIKRQPNNLANLDNRELELRIIANRIFAKIWQQQVEQRESQEKSLKESNSLAENVALRKNRSLEQLRRLIEAAIAYFFGRQLEKLTLDEISDIAPSKEAWLTMEDVFGDDNGPWPLPLEYESHAFNKSPDRNVIHSSGELQNFETTTTQISQDRIEGGLIFEDEILSSQVSPSELESDRPLRAWIETKATLLGYVYNPVMTVVFLLDAVILKIENLIIAIWKGFISFPRRLIRFIRYGNRKPK